MTIDEKVRCLHQVCRPKPIYNIVKDYGCAECAYDAINNPKCPDYYPVKLIEFEVIDNHSL